MAAPCDTKDRITFRSALQYQGFHAFVTGMHSTEWLYSYQFADITSISYHIIPLMSCYILVSFNIIYCYQVLSYSCAVVFWQNWQLVYRSTLVDQSTTFPVSTASRIQLRRSTLSQPCIVT